VMNWTQAVAGREIAAPGSIGNFGPGLDALALAVRLYLRVRILKIVPEDPDTLRCDFIEGPIGGENRIEAAFRHARAAVGLSAPGLHVQVRSDIPPRAGLGSSGAATVAGLRLYEAVTAPRTREELLRLACALEGHPDNAAAALFGGMTVSCLHDDGRLTARSCEWPSAIRLLVATPHVEVATDYARSVLPDRLDRRDAVFNLQHALLLLHAVFTGETGDLREALQDRWHQPYRAPLIPGLTEALALEHPALLGVCLSGAGPSIVAFTEAGESEVVELLENLYEGLGVPCTVRVLAAHQPAEAAAASADVGLSDERGIGRP
jgi:homoserine kinase